VNYRPKSFVCVFLRIFMKSRNKGLNVPLSPSPMFVQTPFCLVLFGFSYFFQTMYLWPDFDYFISYLFLFLFHFLDTFFCQVCSVLYLHGNILKFTMFWMFSSSCCCVCVVKINKLTFLLSLFFFLFSEKVNENSSRKLFELITGWNLILNDIMNSEWS
jgi:hypothetical protein